MDEATLTLSDGFDDVRQRLGMAMAQIAQIGRATPLSVAAE